MYVENGLSSILAPTISMNRTGEVTVLEKGPNGHKHSLEAHEHALVRDAVGSGIDQGRYRHAMIKSVSANDIAAQACAVHCWHQHCL
jgi:hypothetical protein